MQLRLHLWLVRRRRWRLVRRRLLVLIVWVRWLILEADCRLD